MAAVQSIRVNPEGHRRLGEHFIMWSKTRRMRKEGEDKSLGWPPTMEQFMIDVGAAEMPTDGSDTGDAIQIPQRLKSIQFIQSNMETLLVRLPPSDLVEATEASLPEPEGYELPRFYQLICDGTMTNKLEIFQSRVGDYTIAHCK